jgi:hypothetical protein
VRKQSANVKNGIDLKENKMNNTIEQIKQAVTAWEAEDAKFVGGNSAAGTRARKALAEVGKLIKARRNEITAEKNARKEAKAG